MATFLVQRKTSSEIESLPIIDGQFILELDKGNDGQILLDNGDKRIRLGGSGTLDNRTALFTASGWSSTAPFTQTVTLSGMTSTSYPIPILNTEKVTTFSEQKLKQKNFNFISKYEIGLNTIKAVAKFNKPTVDLEIDFRGK